MSRDAMWRAYWVDRRWFDEHPEAISSGYKRPCIDGEFADAIDPDDDDDLETARAVAAAKEVEVWMSDAPARGHQAVRMRRIIGFEYPVFGDGWDEANWMLQAGPPRDDL